jgi:hypothetical protein
LPDCTGGELFGPFACPPLLPCARADGAERERTTAEAAAMKTSVLEADMFPSETPDASALLLQAAFLAGSTVATAVDPAVGTV